MKLLIFFITIFLGSTKQDCIDIKYYKAMQYLNTSKTLKSQFRIKKRDEHFLKASEQIIRLNLYFFKSELKNESISSNIISKNSFIEDSVVKTDLTMKGLSLNHEAKLIVFFSTISENLLLAQVLYRNKESEHFDDLTDFNTGLNVLFMFDRNGDIQKVMEKRINYN